MRARAEKREGGGVGRHAGRGDRVDLEDRRGWRTERKKKRCGSREDAGPRRQKAEEHRRAATGRGDGQGDSDQADIEIRESESWPPCVAAVSPTRTRRIRRPTPGKPSGNVEKNRCTQSPHRATDGGRPNSEYQLGSSNESLSAGMSGVPRSCYAAVTARE